MADTNVTFFLGGARSGKSRLAQAMAETLPGRMAEAQAGRMAETQPRRMAETQLRRMAETQPRRLVYLATGQALDAEMADRIDRHRADRGPRWRTVECPIDLPAAVAREAVAGNVVLVDCLTLWASNVLLAAGDADAASAALRAALGAAAGPVIVVSNEVGLGIVPENALARQFRDITGRLHQDVAAVADAVFFVAAGLSIKLK